MANTNSGAPDEAKPGDAKPGKKPEIDFAALEITIDRSRPVAEIHGEHKLGFIQDGLPFDKGGRLHVESLNNEEYAAGKALLLKRIERLKREEEEATKNPVTDTTNPAPIGPVIHDDPDAHINLVDWAKGKIKVQPHRIYAIAMRRLGKRYSTLAEIAAEMVKRKMIIDSDVKFDK